MLAATICTPAIEVIARIDHTAPIDRIHPAQAAHTALTRRRLQHTHRRVPIRHRRPPAATELVVARQTYRACNHQPAGLHRLETTSRWSPVQLHAFHRRAGTLTL